MYAGARTQDDVYVAANIVQHDSGDDDDDFDTLLQRLNDALMHGCIQVGAKTNRRSIDAAREGWIKPHGTARQLQNRKDISFPFLSRRISFVVQDPRARRERAQHLIRREGMQLRLRLGLRLLNLRCDLAVGVEKTADEVEAYEH